MRVTGQGPSLIGSRLSASVRESARRPRNNLLEMARSYTDVINLGRGDPDLPTSRHIVEAAQAALDEGYTHYTPMNGLPALREAISASIARKTGLQVNPENEVMITTGGQEAVFLLMQALLDPGDEVLIPDPHYTSYDLAAEVAGGKVVPVATYVEDDFLARPEEIERRITPRTKALVIVSPDNPTGALYTQKALEEIGEVVRRRDLVVISDEIYSNLVFPPHHHVSFAQIPGMKERTIIASSFSKSYAMTGWRVGYFVAPADFVGAISTLRHTLTICAPAFAQKAAVAALMGPQDCVSELVRTYDERQRTLVQGLRSIGLDAFEPRGTFYVFADIRSLGIPSQEFAERVLREARVLIYPGAYFGSAGEGFLRASLAVPTARIEEALDRLSAIEVIKWARAQA